MTATLFGFGQTLASDCAVPGAVAASGDPAIRIATLPAEELAPAEVYRWAPPLLRFTAPGVARYDIRADGIAVTPAAGGDPEAVGALLIATALPALLWLQGAFMLHAAALIPAGSEACIAICGASGSGKSTLAALALEHGARLVGDDSIAIRFENERAFAAGLPGGLFMDEGGAGRCFRPVSSDRSVTRAPLGAILFLDPEPTDTAVAALTRILAHQHRPRVPAVLGLRPAALRKAARLAATVPVIPSRGLENATQIGHEAWETIERWSISGGMNGGGHGLAP